MMNYFNLLNNLISATSSNFFEVFWYPEYEYHIRFSRLALVWETNLKTWFIKREILLSFIDTEIL